MNFSARTTEGTGLMRRIRLVAAISTGLALAAGAVAPVAAGTGTGPTATAAADAPASKSLGTVRLITGDRVTVGTDAEGRRTASVTPGAGRQHILFRTYEQDGRLTVLPSDAGVENLGVPVPCRSYDPEVFFAESPADVEYAKSL
ncbi:hypothetical protein ACWD4T_48460, partial [Streptomyces umbrinus]